MNDSELNQQDIERELRNLKPAKAPDHLVDRLTTGLDRVVADSVNREKLNLQTSVDSRAETGAWLARFFRSYATVGAITATLLVVAIWYSIERLSTNEASNNIPNASGLSIPETSAAFEERDLFPFEVENHLLDAEDDGIIATIEDVPFRRVRFQLIDSYTWKRRSDGSSIRMAVPREEILFIPISTF